MRPPRYLLAHRAPIAQQRHQRRQRALLLELLHKHGVHLRAHALKERARLAIEGAHLARQHEHRKDKLCAKCERTP